MPPANGSRFPIPYAPSVIGRSNYLRVNLTPTNQFFRLRAAP